MRRGEFIIGTIAGGSLVFAFPIASAHAAQAFTPNAYLTLEADGGIVVTLPMTELGQGIGTALAMLAIEELDGSWDRTRVVMADADKPVYPDQGIGGSRTMRKQTQVFREAGAVTRAALVNAAASQWNVAASSCTTRNSVVKHDASARSATYASLIGVVASQPVPADPPLKSTQDFRIVGKPQALLEAGIKSTGRARYAIDVRVPGMVHASIERAPRLGAALVSLDAAATLRSPGVIAVERFDEPPFADAFPFWPGVAVVANSTWNAMKGRKALHARWSDGPHAAVTSDAVHASLLKGLDEDGYVAVDQGGVAAIFANAARVVEATYRNPLQAHAAMEPQNATASVTATGCEIWVGTQGPIDVQEMAAGITGLPQEKVIVHQMLAGGGFGRRSDYDPAMEAVMLSKRLGRPVQVLWTREDDFQHDVYRPTNVSRVRAALDAQGKLLAIDHHYAGASIGIERGYKKRDEADTEALGGIIRIVPYAYPAYRVRFTHVDGIPVHFGWWRAVSEAQNAFAQESFIDEVAHATGTDPYAFRRGLLASNPRALAVLDRAATVANWSNVPAGAGRGMALAPYGNTLTAQIVDVVPKGDSFRVTRVVCAIDCGMPVNPRTIEAQMQGGIAWALGATLKHEVTLAAGKPVQANFDTFSVARITDMPNVRVEILASEDPPSAVGEAGVPPFAPAVANAIFALTGKRLRELPLR